MEFLGGLGVRILCFHHCGLGSVPSLGTEIPHQATALHQKKKKKITNCTVDFYMGMSASLSRTVYLLRNDGTLHSAAHFFTT